MLCVVCSLFLLLCSIPFYEQAIVYLSILLLVGFELFVVYFVYCCVSILPGFVPGTQQTFDKYLWNLRVKCLVFLYNYY